MLRHLENDRFVEALRALRRHSGGPVPPPHALLRLGRWLLDQGGHPKAAVLPLELFLGLYPAHQDRLRAQYDLVRALRAAGRTRAALEVAAEAKTA